MNSPDDKTLIVSAPAGQDDARAAEGGRASAQAPQRDSPDETAGTPIPEDDATRLVPRLQTQVAATPATQTTQAGSAEAGAHEALPVGTVIAEFEIVGLIGEGGFGIVYLAWDTLLRRHVALKEYIPASLATRAANASNVTVRSQRHEETFRAGLKSFINEARLLAQFDHHSLVKVYRFWEANGTAYMVMPYYEGLTLKEALRQMSTPPGEPWLRALLAPLLEALGVLHAAQCYHRDIAPDNIMLLKGSQRPLLLDFGAARRVIGDMTQALTVILKPGYAPVEQYAEVPSMKQGPWTDIYALAAVVYCAIKGATPPASVGRLMSDSYVPLATVAADRYSERFLRAIDHALAVRPEDRPQDVQALAAELGIALGDGANAPPFDDDETGTALRAQSSGTAQRASTPVAPPGENRAPASHSAARTLPPGRASNAATAAAAGGKGSKRGGTIAAVGAGVAIIAAIGAWFALRPSGAPPAASTQASATTATPAATAPAAPASATAELPPVPPPAATASTPAGTAALAPVAPPAASAPPTEAAAAPPLPPFTPSGEFERIVAMSDPSIRVTTKLHSTRARIKKDFLQFQVTSNRAGHVYAFMVDPQGEYLMLLPNQRDKANGIAAGQTLTLPRASWPMLADAPAGPIHFLVLVSPEPRDFADAGLRQGDVFADIPASAQAQAAARRTGSDSPFAGKARCAPGASTCNDAYGAATFQIDVVGNGAGQ
ncbi:serine/threonine-protein kinase [Paraburkholderia unamae]|uniref:non-specific serine/threonine protein kinase n=1 Tax=Paraburkholderia unamae TaxID=219649 RepID=A0ABX5KDN7_9BURK|nr:serine/threonine-protein kinase [Paraburkholderia unamae]PVX75231.1 hypothetical protein C7402_118163 [Paraburkholderia unamae]